MTTTKADSDIFLFKHEKVVQTTEKRRRRTERQEGETLKKDIHWDSKCNTTLNTPKQPVHQTSSETGTMTILNLSRELLNNFIGDDYEILEVNIIIHMETRMTQF